jgi:hypothetical protein
MEISTIVLLCPQQKYFFESISFQRHFRAFLDTSIPAGIIPAAGTAIPSSTNLG